MTNFYDFNIKPNIEVVETLEKFGYTGACIFYDCEVYDENIIEQFNQLCDSTNLKLYHGIRIRERNPQLLSKNVHRYSNKVDLIMADGHNDKINRTICQTRQIDIFNKPYENKNNAGINHILANLLEYNNITLNINMTDVLDHNGFYKAKIISNINQIFELQEKYNFNTIVSSGSKSFYDVKSPEDMQLLSTMFEVDEKNIHKMITSNVEHVINNIERKQKYIIEGVKVID